MQSISITDFTAEVRRYFLAEDLDDAALAPLYARWQELERDPARLSGLRRTVGSGAAAVGRGLAWYEALADRAAPTPLEVARATVAIDTAMPAPPAPRPHCPDWLCGTWRRTAVAEDGLRFVEAGSELAWTLSPDGALATRGDPDLDGGSWRVHEAGSSELMIRGPRQPRWRHWVIVRRAGDELDVLVAGATHRQLRFARVDR